MLMAMNEAPGISCGRWISIPARNMFGKTAYFRRTCTDSCGRQRTEYGDRYENVLPSKVTEAGFGSPCAAVVAPPAVRPTIGPWAGVSPVDVSVAAPPEAPPAWAATCSPWRYRGRTAMRTCKPAKRSGSRGRSAAAGQPRKQTYDIYTGALSGLGDLGCGGGCAMPVMAMNGLGCGGNPDCKCGVSGLGAGETFSIGLPWGGGSPASSTTPATQITSMKQMWEAVRGTPEPKGPFECGPIRHVIGGTFIRKCDEGQFMKKAVVQKLIVSSSGRVRVTPTNDQLKAMAIRDKLRFEKKNPNGPRPPERIMMNGFESGVSGLGCAGKPDCNCGCPGKGIGELAADAFISVEPLPIAGAILGYMFNKKLSGAAFGVAIAFGVAGLFKK